MFTIDKHEPDDERKARKSFGDKVSNSDRCNGTAYSSSTTFIRETKERPINNNNIGRRPETTNANGPVEGCDKSVQKTPTAPRKFKKVMKTVKRLKLFGTPGRKKCSDDQKSQPGYYNSTDQSNAKSQNSSAVLESRHTWSHESVGPPLITPKNNGKVNDYDGALTYANDQTTEPMSRHNLQQRIQSLELDLENLQQLQQSSTDNTDETKTIVSELTMTPMMTDPNGKPKYLQFPIHKNHNEQDTRQNNVNPYYRPPSTTNNTSFLCGCYDNNAHNAPKHYEDEHPAYTSIYQFKQTHSNKHLTKSSTTTTDDCSESSSESGSESSLILELNALDALRVTSSLTSQSLDGSGHYSSSEDDEDDEDYEDDSSLYQSQGNSLLDSNKKEEVKEDEKKLFASTMIARNFFSAMHGKFVDCLAPRYTESP